MMFLLSNQNSKFSFQAKVMMKKLLKNYRNCYVAEKCLNSILLKKRYQFQISIAQIEDLNENCANISRSYHLYFQRNKPLKTVTVGPSQFIVLNNLASLKMVSKMFFIFFSTFFQRLWSCLNVIRATHI